MKKVLSFLLFSFLFLTSVVKAQAVLELTKIGTTDLTGKGIGSTVSAYTYPLRSFSLYGTSNASSSVAIKVDDVTYSATANSTGIWSTYLSNLTFSSHAITVSSTGQSSLNFTLTIATAAATVTPTATPSVAASGSGSSTTLPASGTVENTFLSVALALFLVGFGMAVKYKD